MSEDAVEETETIVEDIDSEEEAGEDKMPNYTYSNRIKEYVHSKDKRISGEVEEEINRLIYNKLVTLTEVSDIIGLKKIPSEYLYYKEYDGELDLIKTSVVKKSTKDFGIIVSKEDLKRLNYIVIERLDDAIYRCEKNGRKTIKYYDI